jgi:hypothetical protein
MSFSGVPFANKLQKQLIFVAKKGKIKKMQIGLTDWISKDEYIKEKIGKQILLAHNQGVPGSSPGGPTIKGND